MKILIDGEVVDTYGGDFTYRYVEYEIENERVKFYEYYSGAKSSEIELIYDEDEIAYLLTLVYSYWHVDFISCEGNERWGIAKTLNDCSEDNLRDQLMSGGGYGDDLAEIISIHETYNPDSISWDFVPLNT